MTHTSRPQPIVLVADDDEGIRHLTRAALEQAGLTVEDVADGQKAVDAFKRLAPDIVMLDVRMPIMDGFEACHTIRHLPGGSHVPILIMTGLNDPESIEQAYDMGATDFIAKPWQVLVLANRVRYMLRAGRVLRALQESQQHLARAQQLARLGSWTWTTATNQVVLSEEALRILGLAMGEFGHTRTAYQQFIHPEDLDTVSQAVEEAHKSGKGYVVDYRVVRRDGSERIVTEHAELLLDEQDQPAGLTATIQDITDRRQAEMQIFLSTYYDHITELPNRRLFHDRLAKALETSARTGAQGAVMLVNIDQFRRMNESRGMSHGDGILRILGQRLLQSLRKGDALSHIDEQHGSTVARLIGDTFSILLPTLTSERDPAKTARRLLSAIHRPLEDGDGHSSVTASIGIALFPTHGAGIDQLVNHAEAALQVAKSNGGNRFEYFETNLETGLHARRTLEDDLRHAIERRELILHYQPQVDIKQWAITAVEAFVRWQHPTRGVVSPAEFIRVAEESGLGTALGEWVIRAACAQQKAWRAAGMPPIRMSVNVSDFHVKQRTLPEIVHLALQDIGPTPDFLELEMTEGAIMHDLGHSLQLLKRLKSFGVRIAVDDFGAGSSSLRELTRLPIDTIKIAPEFVQDAALPNAHGSLTAAVIGVGHGLRCRVVGKKVETPEQLEFLRMLGCDDIQGHLYSSATSPERIVQLLHDKPTHGIRRAAA
ncbi:MAG: EAL domain-containing protein [Nitrospiraceae bacterium]